MKCINNVVCLQFAEITMEVNENLTSKGDIDYLLSDIDYLVFYVCQNIFIFCKQFAIEQN